MNGCKCSKGNRLELIEDRRKMQIKPIKKALMFYFTTIIETLFMSLTTNFSYYLIRVTKKRFINKSLLLK